MFLAAINKPKRLLQFSFIGQVSLDDLERSRAEVAELVADLPVGFRLLTDLGRLDQMELACETEIGRVMELCDQKEVAMVVRVIPDPRKDIGLNILTLFHYRHRVRTITCDTMEEAGRALQL
jgi:hypothetical protein